MQRSASASIRGLAYTVHETGCLAKVLCLITFADVQLCVCASKGLERHPPSFSFVFTRLDDVNDADATDVFCTHPIFLTLHVLT